MVHVSSCSGSVSALSFNFCIWYSVPSAAGAASLWLNAQSPPPAASIAMMSTMMRLAIFFFCMGQNHPFCYLAFPFSYHSIAFSVFLYIIRIKLQFCSVVFTHDARINAGNRGRGSVRPLLAALFPSRFSFHSFPLIKSIRWLVPVGVQLTILQITDHIGCLDF